MKAIRTVFWTLAAVVFGAVAGVIVAAFTLAAGLLMLRDAILSWCKHPSDLHREKPPDLRR